MYLFGRLLKIGHQTIYYFPPLIKERHVFCTICWLRSSRHPGVLTVADPE